MILKIRTFLCFKNILFYHFKQKTIQDRRADWNILIQFAFLIKSIELYSSNNSSWSEHTYLEELLNHSARRHREKKKQNKQKMWSFYVLSSIWNFLRWEGSADERDQISSEIPKHFHSFFLKKVFKETSMCYQDWSPHLYP